MNSKDIFKTPECPVSSFLTFSLQKKLDFRSKWWDNKVCMEVHDE